MDPLTLGATIQAGLKLIDKFVADPKQKEEAKLEFLKEQNEFALAQSQQDIERDKISMSAINSEAQSEDKFTSRARPGFMYVMYTLFILCMLGAIIGIWYPAEMITASQNLNLLFSAIPSELYDLFKAGFLGYGALRTADKYIETKRQTNLLKQYNLVTPK